MCGKKLFLILTLAFCYMCYSQKRAESFFYTPKRDKRVLSQIPISILEIPTLDSREWLLSYRYWHEAKNGMRTRSTKTSASEVFTTYDFSLERMNQHAHMLQGVYTPIKGFSVLSVMSFAANSIYFEASNDRQMISTFSGLKDLYFAALFLLAKGKTQSLYFNSGIFVPIGSIEESSSIFSMPNVLFPYEMQLGTGSWTPVVGATYLKDFTIGSVGVKIAYRFAGNENRNKHTVGSLLKGNLWAGFNVLKNWGISAHGQYTNLSSLSVNSDDTFFNSATSLFNKANTGKTQIDIGLNVYYKPIMGIFKDQVFAVEYILPIQQRVNGTQLGNASSFVIGLKYTLKQKIKLKKSLIGY